ncbi:MAG: restriction endonuclease subunit S [Desulfamplus sp.]|nr:restriction endonuclease subunit S [Desulfamplus sp.]
MSEWKECKLGDVCLNVLTGGTPSTQVSRYFENGTVPWLKTKEVNFCRIAKTENFITEEGVANSSAKMIPPNSVIIAMYGDTAGRVAINRIPLATNQACCNLVISDKMADCNFIFYLLWNAYFDLVAMKTGSAQPNLNTSLIKSLDILLPPLPEQQAIASVLSSLDDKIDLLHRQNKTLETMAETLFRQWFVEEAEEGWEETTLVQHTEAFRGLSYKGSGLTENGLGIPMHNLNSVYEGGGYKLEGIKFYNDEYKERHRIYPGDVIVTNTEQGHDFKLIGFPAIVPDSFGNVGLFSQHIYRLVPTNQTYLSREFIYYLLMFPSVREQIISATNGSTVNMLAIDGLQRPTFKIPPKGKVIEFTKIIVGHWEKMNVNKKQIRTLETLRDTLLPKLMSGEVRVSL